MPSPKRSRRERTDEWQSIKQWTLWPEQELYEQIRPILLFGETAGERAKETGAAPRTLSRKANEFERYGVQSLFASEEQGGAREISKTLPPEIRQLIVDLHIELPTMSWREIAEVCYIRYARRPDHKSVKHIATASPPRSLQSRRYQPWHLIADPAERKLAAIRLHADGWSITSIASYLQLCRHLRITSSLYTFGQDKCICLVCSLSRQCPGSHEDTDHSEGNTEVRDTAGRRLFFLWCRGP